MSELHLPVTGVNNHSFCFVPEHQIDAVAVVLCPQTQGQSPGLSRPAPDPASLVR